MGELPPVLAALKVSKAFPGVQANNEVSFDVRRGEIHALLGENGAGKSTLAHILAGSRRPDSGHIEIDGRRVEFRSPRDALKAGVGLVAQHFEVVPALTVAENVLLADTEQPWFWSKKRAHATVRDIGARFGFSVDPGAIVEDISLGERQQLEIVRVLYRGAETILLDEPTSVLTPQQSESLFSSLRHMTEQGKSVVIISHKLGEVLAIADRITVMRDGRAVQTVLPSDTSAEQLAFTMVGRDVDLARQPSDAPLGGTYLEVRDVIAVSRDGRTHLNNVSLHVRSGEIVGVAGVSGNGQDLLADAIAGLAEIDSGTVSIRGQRVGNGGPFQARQAGLRFVPGDRLGTGLAPGMTIAENMLLTSPKPLFFRSGRASRTAERMIEEFGIKAKGPSTPVRNLSGGNAQKVLLSRELGHHSDVTVVVSPTWGLDVGAVEFVRGQLSKRRAAGGAVLLISEDLEEIIALSDRVYVICDGKIQMECTGPDYDMSRIGMAMAGASGSGPRHAVVEE
jgi:ABC-type uncharacterized transport system ATPase subunit